MRGGETRKEKGGGRKKVEGIFWALALEAMWKKQKGGKREKILTGGASPIRGGGNRLLCDIRPVCKLCGKFLIYIFF